MRTGEETMNIRETVNVGPDLRMSKAAFIEWDAGEGQRCELVGGRVVMMPRPSEKHGIIVTNLVVLLRTRLDGKQWTVIAEFGLDTGPETLRYPDIVVYPVGGSGNGYTTNTPILLTEVLSPSNTDTDFGDKPAEYLELPCLLTYVVLSQDEPKAWMWSRPSTSARFGGAPKVISGAEDVIPVSGLMLELPIAEIYAGIQTG
jgi:Uma2 family endonuclease